MGVKGEGHRCLCGGEGEIYAGTYVPELFFPFSFQKLKSILMKMSNNSGFLPLS